MLGYRCEYIIVELSKEDRQQKQFCSVITSGTVKNLNCIYKGMVIMTDFENAIHGHYDYWIGNRDWT